MYFITIKRMLEVCFSAHPNIQYRAEIYNNLQNKIQLYEKMILYSLAQFVPDCYNKTTKKL